VGDAAGLHVARRCGPGTLVLTLTHHAGSLSVGPAIRTGRLGTTGSSEWRRYALAELPVTRSARSRLGRCLAFILSSATCLSCGPDKSSAAGPTIFCGQVLWRSPDGAYVVNAFGKLTEVMNLSGGNIFLHLTPSCDRGVRVIVSPSAATIVAQAKARDGGVVAVALHPIAKTFVVKVSDANSQTRTVNVKLN
jgi:hypothetical protein